MIPKLTLIGTALKVSISGPGLSARTLTVDRSGLKVVTVGTQGPSSVSAAELATALALNNSTTAAQTANLNAFEAAKLSTSNSANLAKAYALSAASVAQQDLSGVTAAALHRSPNAITALNVYNTATDPDGGAWVDRMGHTSWENEALTPGRWLTTPNNEGFKSELDARLAGATTGVEQALNGTFDSTANWLTGAGWAIADGKATATATSANLQQGTAQGYTPVSNKLYIVEFDWTHTSGTLSVAMGSGTAVTTNSSGRKRVPLVCGATPANGLQFYGGTVSGSPDNVSIKEVTAFTTGSGDYYPDAVTGKFFRLARNLFKNSAWAGTVGGPGTYPTGWGVLGASSGVVSLLSEAVNGTTTGVARLRRITAGATLEGVNQTTTNGLLPLWATGFGTLILVRVPTGVTAGDLNTYDSGGTTALIASAATLNAQAKDTWVSYTVTHTPTGSRTSFGFGMSSGAIGTGVDLALPSLEIGAVTTYDATATTAGQEVFRGNKRKHPKLRYDVAEAGRVVMYDGTEPGSPMWMVIARSASQNAVDWFWTSNNTASATSVAALNGKVGIGTAGYGLKELDFLADKAITRYTGSSSTQFLGNIAERHQNRPALGAGIAGIVNATVNSVAMTVLPDAPLDAVTGLQVPTIVVATGTGASGGISILKQDGTVAHITGQADAPKTVVFNARGEIVTTGDYTNELRVYSTIPTGTVNFTTTSRTYYPMTQGGTSARLLGNNNTTIPVRASGRGVEYLSSTLGATLLRENPSSQIGTLAAHITGTYNTGYMAGDIRRCWLADVVAGTVSAPELVTNGTNPTATTGWAATNCTVAVVGSELEITATAVGVTYAAFSFATVAGRTYSLGGSGYRKQASGTIYLGVVGGVPTAYGAGSTLTSLTAFAPLTFVATGTGVNVNIRLDSGAIGDKAAFNLVSVKEAVDDRSVKAKPLSIIGTLARTVVALGAQMVAYSGFSNDANQNTELVTNGTFTTDTASWTAGSGTFTAAAGIATLTNAGTAVGYASQVVTTVPGRSYTLIGFIGPGTGSVNPRLTAGSAPLNADLLSLQASGANTYTGTFVANATTTTITATTNSTTSGAVATFDNVSVKPHSAIGSAANVLQEAYSADLDYGTGAWTAAGWVNVPVTGFGPANFIYPSAADTGFVAAGTTPPAVLNSQVFVGKSSTKVTFTAASAVGYAGTRAGLTGILGQAMTAGVPTISGIKVALSRALTGTEQVAVYWVSGYGQTQHILTAANSAAHVNAFVEVACSATAAAAVSTTILYPVTFLNSALGSDIDVYLAEGHINFGDVLKPYVATTAAIFNGIAPIIDRSGPSGAYWRMGLEGTGKLAAEAFDGTTTRRVTSPAAYNTATGLDARANYAASGTLSLLVNGDPVAITTGTPLLTLTNTLALATGGNSRNLDAAFPGTICLLKTGVTLPSIEQMRWMFAQERPMFQASAQVTIADTGSVLDLTYDEQTDTYTVNTATNSSEFSGFVRTAVRPVPAGTYSKASARSGVRLSARITTNPGVDITMPAQNLKEQLLRRAEDAARLGRSTTDFDYAGGFTATSTVGGWTLTSVAALSIPAGVNIRGSVITGTGIPTGTTIVDLIGTTAYLSAAATAAGTAVAINFTTLWMPTGVEAAEVIGDGLNRQEGATKAFTRVNDGFRNGIAYVAVPGNTAWIQFKTRRVT